MGDMDDNYFASRCNRGAKEQWLLLNKRETNIRYSHIYSNQDLRTGGFAGHAAEGPAQAKGQGPSQALSPLKSPILLGHLELATKDPFTGRRGW